MDSRSDIIKTQIGAFRSVVSAGNLDSARNALNLFKEITVNSLLNDDDDTALHIAVRLSNKALVDFLLSKGANPEIVNKKNKTPIALAVDLNLMDLCASMLDANDKNKKRSASVSPVVPEKVVSYSPGPVSSAKVVSSSSNMPSAPVPKRQQLINAIKEGQTLEVGKLLKDGMTANVLIDKEPAIIFAVRTGKLEIYDLLVQSGARTDVKFEGKAVLNTKPPRIISEQDLPRIRAQQEQALIEAVVADDVRKVRDLFRGGLLPDISVQGEPILHFIIRGNKTEMLECFLDKRMTLPQSLFSPAIALEFAIESDKLDCVNVFLRRWMDYNIDLDMLRQGALKGCQLNRTEIAKRFINMLAKYDTPSDIKDYDRYEFPDFNKKKIIVSSNGNTFLHWAAEHGNRDLISFLLSHTNEISRNHLGRTPAQLAIAAGRVNCLDLLATEEMKYATQYSHLELMCELVSSVTNNEMESVLTEWLSLPRHRADSHILDMLITASVNNQRLLSVLHFTQFSLALARNDVFLICKMLPKVRTDRLFAWTAQDQFWPWVDRIKSNPVTLAELVKVSEGEMLTRLRKLQFQYALNRRDKNLICELILLNEPVNDDFWHWVDQLNENDEMFIGMLRSAADKRPDILQRLKRVGELPDDIKDFFNDPITCDLLKAPVILPHGDTYNRGTVLNFGRRDPITRNQFADEDVLPNNIMAALIKYYKTAEDLTVIPPVLVCPLSKKLFTDPVVAVNGETYDEFALTRHLRTFSNTLPGGRRQDKVAYENKVVKELIQKMKYGMEKAASAKVEKPISSTHVVQAALVPQSTKAPAAPQIVQLLSPAQPVQTLVAQEKVPSLESIMDVFEDSISLDLFENPIIYYTGITYSKSQALTFKKDPADVTQDFEMSETVPNLLVAELITYFSNKSVDLKNIPSLLECPLSKKIFQTPVVAEDGKTYEKEDLERYLRGHRMVLPNSDKKQSTFLYPNLVVEKLIGLYKPAPVAAANNAASSGGMFAPSQPSPNQQHSPSQVRPNQ